MERRIEVHGGRCSVLRRLSLNKLPFIRYHSEERRIALLLRSLSGQQNLVGVARVVLSLSRDGSLPPFDAARNRNAEFLKRCVEALKKVNPTAETDPKKLTLPEQQRLALALEATARPCHKCSRSAKDPVPASEICITWIYDEGDGEAEIAVPEAAAGKVFCAACVDDGRILMCLQCGRDDALVHADRAWVSNIMFMGFHATSTRCTRCESPAVITASRQDKRKNNAAELQRTKRLRLA